MTDPASIERDMEKVSQLARQDRYAEALQLGAELDNRYPRSARVHSLLGYVHARKEDYDEAIREISTALELAPGEPAYHFNRALWQLEAGHHHEVIADCTSVIAIETRLGRTYYLDSAYFIRALAKSRMRDDRGALDDCQHVADGWTFWALGQLQTKSALVALVKQRSGEP